MGNTGLNNGEKYLNFTYGDITAYVNVNKSNSNLIVKIPCVSTQNGMIMDAAYNLKNDTGNNIASGIRVKYETRITKNNNSYSFEEYDGSIQTYQKDVYNKKTGLTLKEENDNLVLYDLGQNTIKYENTSSVFPLQITQGNNKILFNYDTVTKTKPLEITLNNDKIKYNIYNPGTGKDIYAYVRNTNQSEYVTTSKAIAHYQKDETEYTYYFQYDDEKITFRLTSEYFQISSSNSNRLLRFYFDNLTNKRITKIEEKYVNCSSYSKVVNIVYYDGYTKINTPRIDYDDEKYLKESNSYVFFDSLNNVLYEIDKYGNYSYVDFNNTLGKVNVKSASFYPDINKVEKFNKETGIFYGSFVEEEAVVDINKVIINQRKYTLSGQGESRVEYKLADNCVGGNEYSAFLLIKASDASLSVTLGSNHQSVSKNISNLNYYQLVMLDLKESQNHDYIKISISGTGTFYVGCVYLLNKCMLSQYTYNDKGMVTKEWCGGIVHNYEYDENYSLIKKICPESEIIENEFTNRTIKTISSNYIKTTPEYNEDKTKIIKQTTTSTLINKSLVQEVIYDGEKKKNIIDENDNKQTYEYFNDYRISSVVNGNNQKKQVKLKSDNKSLVDSLIFSKENESNKVNYHYDALHRVDQVTNSNNDVYIFNYDELDNIESVQLNGVIISTFIYNKTTGLLEEKSLSNGGEYKYFYDENGNVTKVTIGTLEYNYEYDNFDRILQIKDGSNNVLKTYAYNEEYTKEDNIEYKDNYVINNNVIEEEESLGKQKQNNPLIVSTLLLNNDLYNLCVFNNNYKFKEGISGNSNGNIIYSVFVSIYNSPNWVQL